MRFRCSLRLPVRLSRNGRRLVILGAIIVTAIAASAVWQVSVQRDAALEAADKFTENLAHVLVEQTARTLQPVDLSLLEVAGHLNSIAAISPNGAADWAARSTHDFLVEKLKVLPQADALAIVGPNGRLISHSNDFPAPTPDLSQRDYFQHFQSLDDRGVFVGAPVKSLVSGRWSVFLARRINGTHNEFAGVVIAPVTLSYLEDFYRAAMPADFAVTLLQQDGTVLVRYPPVEAKVGRKLPQQATWYRRVAEGGGSYRSPGFLDGQVRLVFVHPMREFPLVIDASTSEVAALLAWGRQASWMLGGTLLKAAVVTFLLWVFGRQLDRVEQSRALLARRNDELETGRRNFNAVLNNVSQGIVFFDGDEKLAVCNARYAGIYGLSAEQTRPGTSFSCIARYREVAGSLETSSAEAHVLRAEAAASVMDSFDVTEQLPDGRAIHVHFQPLSGGGWVSTHEDITQRKRAEASLAFLARHDALTELPNRTLFQERLTEAIAMTRNAVQCALLCLDLDRFKVINDTLGHPVGDELLRAVAGRLAAVVRQADTVARLGGDEFAIVQTGLASAEHAGHLAERIIATLRRPFDIGGQRIVAGASIGIALAPDDGATSETLLKKADIALYLAKTEGRGTWRFFEPEMDARAQELRLVELELRNALPAQDFELHYQPILDLRSGVVTGFEALIRWNHPVRGLISPADFIPIAEETGLIVPIGEWALRTACAAAANWPEHVEIAVNLSPIQFKDSQLLATVQNALEASGLAPHRLELEITETVLLQNSDDRLALLHSFRALGIRIALDDFGTGYSSLSYLRSFPFDKIKIDRSFIIGLGTANDSRVIVGAVIDLAHSLGMTTVAEGVETAAQLAALQETDCNKVQGYLFSRPVPAAAVPAVIEGWTTGALRAGTDGVGLLYGEAIEPTQSPAWA